MVFLIVMLKNMLNKFYVITKNTIPSSLKLEYENIQISHNIYRFKFTCIILFAINVFLLFFAPKLNNKAVISGNIISILFIIASVVFYILLYNIDKITNKIRFKWYFCYSFVYVICIIQFLNIINVTINQQPSFPFILAINLLVILPDFKPKCTVTLIILIYLSSLFVQISYLPITPLSIIKIINISVFTLICIITNIFLYKKDVRVFLNEIKLKEMNEHFALLSTIDELTELPNRRAFNYFYDNIWIHCKRLQLPLCVIMIDIDYFKKYNDILGHIEGDKALQAVSKCLKSCIKRDTDFIARYGGEEFVCIIPYIKYDDAYRIIEKILKSVEQLKIIHPHKADSYLTVSIGATLISLNNHTVFTNKDTVLESADKALYEAKNTGRNKIVFYDIEKC